MQLPDTKFAKEHASIITRWEYAYKKATTGYTYFSQCSEDGCETEISLYKYSKRQKGVLKCRLCSKLQGHLAGVAIYKKRVWERRNEIVEFRFEQNRWYPYIACKSHGCSNPVKMRHSRYKRNGKPNAGYCRKHLNAEISIRVFEPSYNMLVRQASKRSIELGMTYDEYAVFCRKRLCAYCKAPIVRKNAILKTKSNACFLDRKNPRLGYTADNCVPCCTPCNLTKNVYLTEQEMRVVGALRSGNSAIAAKIAAATDTTENTRQHHDAFDYVWKSRSQKLRTPYMDAVRKRWADAKGRKTKK